MFCFIPWIVLLHFAEFSLQFRCPDTPWSNLGCTADCVDVYGNGLEYNISSCPGDALPANKEVTSATFYSVGFSYSGLETIKNFAFDGLSIYALIFAHSFTTVEPRAFSGIKDLGSLMIINNPKLTWLPKGLFKNLTDLAYIHLVYNGLTKIHSDTLVGMSGISYIGLYGNDFTCISYDLFPQTRSTNKIDIMMTNPSSTDNLELQTLQKYGVEQTSDVELTGFCAKSFSGIKASVRYGFKVSNCVKECATSVDGLQVNSNTKKCNCSSIEGCLDDNCKAETVPTKQADNLGPTPGNSSSGFAIPKTTLLPSRASQTILPGNLCLTLGVSLGVIGLVLLFLSRLN